MKSYQKQERVFQKIGERMIELLDTNIILRFLVGDNKLQQKEASLYFKEAESGKRKILVKPLVIAEACFVLESFYKKDKDEIADSMEVFLSQKWLKVEDRQPILAMWQWYRKNLHFVDSYLLACAKLGKFKILTFDKTLNKKLQDYLD
jgi:predicted nucleic-acid-binding protein